VYQALIKVIDSTRTLHEKDPNLNQSLFKIKDTCQKIEVMNESNNVEVVGESYIDRLKSCQQEFSIVVKTIEKYKQQERMQRNTNMAQLYFLMAENQYKLGLISKSLAYLK
jgi:hypothetical protein